MAAFSVNDLVEFAPLLAQGGVITVEIFACGLLVATLLGLIRWPPC